MLRGMSDKKVFKLDAISVVDVRGADASQIVHNLTTNDIKKLAVGDVCESFVTDVRGKTLGHVSVLRLEDGFRLFGAAGQSQAIHDHVDRYTIREDAMPAIRDDEFTAFVYSPEDSAGSPEDNVAPDSMVGGIPDSLSVEWLGEGTRVRLAQGAQAVAALADQAGDMNAFHEARIRAGFPWYGTDLSAKNLPQEADREPQTISFTKGCYLGQETVARLDALGQVQKKLVRWEITEGVPSVGMELRVGEKTVGRLTSVLAISDSTAMAIGIARRSHFEPGSKATVYAAGGESKVIAQATTA